MINCFLFESIVVSIGRCVASSHHTLSHFEIYALHGNFLIINAFIKIIFNSGQETLTLPGSRVLKTLGGREICIINIQVGDVIRTSFPFVVGKNHQILKEM